MAAPYQNTPHGSSTERRRAAILRALGGLAARGPALGTDPFGSFQAGLRGAIDTGAEQGAQDAQAAQLEEMNRFRRMEAQAALDRADRAGQQDYTPQPWYMDPRVDQGVRTQYQADALYHPERAAASNPYQQTQDRLRGEFDYLNGNPAARAMGIGSSNPAPQPRQMSAWQANQIDAWLAQHPGAKRDDAMAALTYNAPVIMETETQARDDMNAPLWIGPDGRVTTNAMDMRTRQPNRPFMVKQNRGYGSRFGGGGAPADSGGLGRFVR